MNPYFHFMRPIRIGVSSLSFCVDHVKTRISDGVVPDTLDLFDHLGLVRTCRNSNISKIQKVRVYFDVVTRDGSVVKVDEINVPQSVRCLTLFKANLVNAITNENLIVRRNGVEINAKSSKRITFLIKEINIYFKVFVDTDKNTKSIQKEVEILQAESAENSRYKALVKDLEEERKSLEEENKRLEERMKEIALAKSVEEVEKKKSLEEEKKKKMVAEYKKTGFLEKKLRSLCKGTNSFNPTSPEKGLAYDWFDDDVPVQLNVTPRETGSSKNGNPTAPPLHIPQIDLYISHDHKFNSVDELCMMTDAVWCYGYSKTMFVLIIGDNNFRRLNMLFKGDYLSMMTKFYLEFLNEKMKNAFRITIRGQEVPLPYWRKIIAICYVYDDFHDPAKPKYCSLDEEASRKAEWEKRIGRVMQILEQDKVKTYKLLDQLKALEIADNESAQHCGLKDDLEFADNESAQHCGLKDTKILKENRESKEDKMKKVSDKSTGFLKKKLSNLSFCCCKNDKSTQSVNPTPRESTRIVQTTIPPFSSPSETFIKTPSAKVENSIIPPTHRNASCPPFRSGIFLSDDVQKYSQKGGFKDFGAGFQIGATSADPYILQSDSEVIANETARRAASEYGKALGADSQVGSTPAGHVKWDTEVYPSESFVNPWGTDDNESELSFEDYIIKG